MRDAISREVALTGQYEPQETALMKRLLRRGTHMVDIGANWGYFALLASRIVGGDGRVTAYEPDPRSYARLIGNLELNGFNNVLPFRLAVSDRRGEIELFGYQEEGGNFGTSSVTRTADAATMFSVPSDTLDSMLVEGETIGFLKMDIEGGEVVALEGMKRLLKDHVIERLLLELHPQHLELAGSSAKALIEYISGFGYRGWSIDHSAAATREVAYHPATPLSQFLAPISPEEPGPWPHIIWESPDLDEDISIGAILAGE